METTTVGKLLLKEHLPQDMHAFIDANELDKSGNAKLFNLLAEKHPDTYNKIVSELARLGFEVSTRMGHRLDNKSTYFACEFFELSIGHPTNIVR